MQGRINHGALYALYNAGAPLVRGAEIEKPKVSMGKRREEVPLPQPIMGLGKRHCVRVCRKLPRWGPGHSPGRKRVFELEI